MSDRKIRVVFGVNDFLVGGMQRQFVDQLRFFNYDHFEILLISLFEFPNQPNLYDSLPTDFKVYRLDFKNVRNLSAWIDLYRLLKLLKPDIVISSLFFANTAFRLLKLILGYKVIACEHNTYIDKLFFHRVIDRVLALITYRILAVSTSVATFTAKQERIARKKFIIIPNGIDTDKWKGKFAALPSKLALRREMGIQSDSMLLLTVARLTPQKNQKLLLESFAQFQFTHTDSVLAIVGYGPLREELELYAEELSIKDNVLFFDAQNDVARFYKASDIFVLTSTIEGFSLVCMEAMSAGLPVVSTATAGPDEYIKDGVNGFLVYENSANAVAAALERVTRSNLNSIQKEAVKTAELYDISTSVKLYENLFYKAVQISQSNELS